MLAAMDAFRMQIDNTAEMMDVASSSSSSQSQQQQQHHDEVVAAAMRRQNPATHPQSYLQPGTSGQQQQPGLVGLNDGITVAAAATPPPPSAQQQMNAVAFQQQQQQHRFQNLPSTSTASPRRLLEMRRQHHVQSWLGSGDFRPAGLPFSGPPSVLSVASSMSELSVVTRLDELSILQSSAVFPTPPSLTGNGLHHHHPGSPGGRHQQPSVPEPLDILLPRCLDAVDGQKQAGNPDARTNLAACLVALRRSLLALPPEAQMPDGAAMHQLWKFFDRLVAVLHHEPADCDAELWNPLSRLFESPATLSTFINFNLQTKGLIDGFLFGRLRDCRQLRPALIFILCRLAAGDDLMTNREDRKKSVRLTRRYAKAYFPVLLEEAASPSSNLRVRKGMLLLIQFVIAQNLSAKEALGAAGGVATLLSLVEREEDEEMQNLAARCLQHALKNRTLIAQNCAAFIASNGVERLSALFSHPSPRLVQSVLRCVSPATECAAIGSRDMSSVAAATACLLGMHDPLAVQHATNILANLARLNPATIPILMQRNVVTELLRLVELAPALKEYFASLKGIESSILSTMERTAEILHMCMTRCPADTVRQVLSKRQESVEARVPSSSTPGTSSSMMVMMMTTTAATSDVQQQRVLAQHSSAHCILTMLRHVGRHAQRPTSVKHIVAFLHSIAMSCCLPPSAQQPPSANPTWLHEFDALCRPTCDDSSLVYWLCRFLVLCDFSPQCTAPSDAQLRMQVAENCVRLLYLVRQCRLLTLFRHALHLFCTPDEQTNPICALKDSAPGMLKIVLELARCLADVQPPHERLAAWATMRPRLERLVNNASLEMEPRQQAAMLLTMVTSVPQAAQQAMQQAMYHPNSGYQQHATVQQQQQQLRQ